MNTCILYKGDNSLEYSSSQNYKFPHTGTLCTCQEVSTFNHKAKPTYSLTFQRVLSFHIIIIYFPYEWGWPRRMHISCNTLPESSVNFHAYVLEQTVYLVLEPQNIIW